WLRRVPPTRDTRMNSAGRGFGIRDTTGTATSSASDDTTRATTSGNTIRSATAAAQRPQQRMVPRVVVACLTRRRDDVATGPGLAGLDAAHVAGVAGRTLHPVDLGLQFGLDARQPPDRLEA